MRDGAFGSLPSGSSRYAWAILTAIYDNGFTTYQSSIATEWDLGLQRKRSRDAYRS
jgi:hypothetical protein